MELGVIGTGSFGNSYFLKNADGEILLLDAGLSVKEIKVGISFEIGSVSGCVVTHAHS